MLKLSFVKHVRAALEQAKVNIHYYCGLTLITVTNCSLRTKTFTEENDSIEETCKK